MSRWLNSRRGWASLTASDCASCASSPPMSSARRLYLLNVGLASLAAVAVALAAVVAITRLRPGLPSTEAIAAACQRMVPLDPGLAVLLVGGLAGLGITVLILGARSVLRQLAAQRRLLAALEPVETVTIDASQVQVVDGDRPIAFCAGALHPRIYVSAGSLARLTDGELRAIVAHERHHQQSRDPLRILLVRVLADALFFLPTLRLLAERYRQLAELAADDAAAGAHGRSALASALLRFGERRGEAAPVAGIAPERVDHLLGATPRWRLSVSALLGTLLILVSLLALVVSAPRLVGAQSLSLASLLAEGCMVAMIAGPIALAAGATYLSRAHLRARSQAR
ncbi:MAG: M48 family metalloprotease [Solirubrobacterales bacterium]|nr:M48 family metalloprotease [Solirubrobacterales bacterium]